MGGGVPKQYPPARRQAGAALGRGVARPAPGGATRSGRDRHRTGELATATPCDGLDVGELSSGRRRARRLRSCRSRCDRRRCRARSRCRPPLLPAAVIDRLLARLEFFEGATPVLPVGDTLARAGGRSTTPSTDRTVPRPNSAGVSPQSRFGGVWTLDRPAPTDETTVMRAAGMARRGRRWAIRRSKSSTFRRISSVPSNGSRPACQPRTGMGFDVHAFSGEGPIMLGGIAVPHCRGLAGHSDADVVLHAITDALLGAAGLGDIGEHFPPSDPQWKGASSSLFLAMPSSCSVPGGDHRSFRLHDHRRSAERRPVSVRHARTNRRDRRP